MIFRPFYYYDLGCAAYLFGCGGQGLGAVVDPQAHDVENYLSLASSKGLRITHVIDTHVHADHRSGGRTLAEKAGASYCLHRSADVSFAFTGLDDGQVIELGNTVMRVLHTPGHTPDSICAVVTDRSRGKEPALLLSGGALLVGDVARPDLLGSKEDTEKYAAATCRTLQEKILTLPDFVEVYPTHVAGSLCGGSIGSRLSTTIGYERRLNKILAELDQQEKFVRSCLNLKELPAVPPYWPRMRRLNQAGPPPLGMLAQPPALSSDEFERRARDGGVVLDCRSAEAFAAHIPKALNVGIGSSFATWAGTVLPPEKVILLVLESANDLWEICWQLLRIGYELPVGWLAGGMFRWRTAGKPIEKLPQIDVWMLQDRLKNGGDALVLDVRQPKEWHSGHIRGALHITGAELPRRIDEVPKQRPIAAICGSGYRSSVAASLLQTSGYKDVVNVLGGMNAWNKAGMPTVAEAES